MIRARVFHSAKRVFVCQRVDTREMLEATALAMLIKGREEHIVAGDYVWLDENNTIVEIEKRTNEIFRMIPRERKRKVTAANCDVMVVVSSISKPEYKRGLVDRYLIRGAQWEVPALLVFNKMDEWTDEFDLAFEADRLAELGVDCFEVSALEADRKPTVLKYGLGDLKERLKNCTSIFLGQSGVGKSRLISTLTDGKISLESGHIGREGKGTHTTTWAHLIESEGRTFIDSPGVRSFAIDDIIPEDLPLLFPDLQRFFSACAFVNCQHDEDSKGCAFMALDDSLPKNQGILSRLESYIRFREEVTARDPWEKSEKKK